MDDTPILDTFFEDMKSSLDAQAMEERLTQTLIAWMNKTIKESAIGVSLGDDGRLQVYFTTPDDIEVLREFNDAIGVGAFTEGEDRETAAALAVALRAVADSLDRDAAGTR